jgi:hypothetical protein
MNTELLLALMAIGLGNRLTKMVGSAIGSKLNYTLYETRKGPIESHLQDSIWVRPFVFTSSFSYLLHELLYIDDLGSMKLFQISEVFIA